MRHAEHSAASWQISILAYWHISNLLTMQHYKALFTLGIPIVIGQIGVIILGFADTLMIGHHSTNELAAASFVNNMFTLAIIFATGFSYGLTPIVGSLFGRGETHVVGRMLKNSLFANTLLAVLLTLIMWILYLNIHRLATRRTAAFNASLLHRFTDILVVCTAFQRFQAICRWHNRHPRFHVDLIGRKCDEHHRQLHPDLR